MTPPKKKLTLSRRCRRWKRRFLKRHPGVRRALPFLQGLLGFVIVLLIGALFIAAFWPEPTDRVALSNSATAQPASTPNIPPISTIEPTATPIPTPTVEPTPTAEPTPIPGLIDGIPEEYYAQTVTTVVPDADPSANKLIKTPVVYVSGKKTSSYQAETPISMPASAEYAAVEGVTTFRGSNYRDGAAYGTIPENPTDLEIVWTKKIGRLDKWSGVGWTGQASCVRWPEETRQMMNIVDEKKNKDGLIEVFYGTLDGRIYFLDMEDGQPTRDPINIGAPIKGSVSVDPRGIPLLYCGQGIYDVNGKRVKCGTRVWSLINQELLFTLNGADEFAERAWRAFDCAPLVDPNSDTMLTVGENGVLYSVKLNTTSTFDGISIDPQITRYVYTQHKKGKIGTEGSLNVYNNYAYFANNTGIIQCVDLNTMELKWSFYGLDDIDASMVIEVEEDGLVALYATNEVDLRGSRGTSQMFKLNALTGELIWYRDSDDIYQNDENGGGSFATPAVGKGELGDIVYFHVARTKSTKGMMYALSKETGEIVWAESMGSYGWSSPTCLYTQSGKGYVLVGSSNGVLRLMDGLTGQTVAKIDVEYNIEGSPIVFDDMIVIGNRGGRIHGIRIK